ncbi:hypothetical protein Tco_1036039 [Tanacetum coccineum]
MAQANRKSSKRYTSHHEHHHKEDLKITIEDSWNESNEDDHEEACLMASQKITIEDSWNESNEDDHEEACLMPVGSQKKQTALAISKTEAEYVAAGKACQQALCMKQAIKDYNIHCEDVLVLVITKGNILMEKVAFEDNITDILTKPLKRKTFNYLRLGLGMLKHEE